MTAEKLPEVRLFVEAPLSVGASVTCTPEQANYLVNVMRLAAGADILLFNGWYAGDESAKIKKLYAEAAQGIGDQKSGAKGR